MEIIKPTKEYMPTRYFSVDGLMEIEKYLAENNNATVIPDTLFVSRKNPIPIDKKFFILTRDTLSNIKQTVYNGNEALFLEHFHVLLDKIQKNQ